MTTLVKTITKSDQQLFNARDIHSQLDIKTKFADWITRRLKEFGFTENQDFSKKNIGRETDYYLIKDAARDILACERKNPKSKKLRQWLWDNAEQTFSKTTRLADNTDSKVSQSTLTKPITSIQLIAAQAQALVQLESKQLEHDDRLSQLEARARFSTDTGFYTVRGYAAINGYRLPLSRAQTIGKIASRLSRQYNVKTGKAHCEVFGEVNTYHSDILEEAFTYENR